MLNAFGLDLAGNQLFMAVAKSRLGTRSSFRENKEIGNLHRMFMSPEISRATSSGLAAVTQTDNGKGAVLSVPRVQEQRILYTRGINKSEAG